MSLAVATQWLGHLRLLHRLKLTYPNNESSDVDSPSPSVSSPPPSSESSPGAGNTKGSSESSPAPEVLLLHLCYNVLRTAW